MEITIFEEAGYEQAKYGFSLSFKDREIPIPSWWSDERSGHFEKVLEKNANRGGGHNKFLEHIMVWLDIEASLEWWKQMDTYRVGVSKQSESTMHTLDKRDVDIDDFDLSREERDSYFGETLDIPVSLVLESYLFYLNQMPSRIKSKLLPQGYKQRRQIVLSYKVLRHIINQRKGHKLPEWSQFIDTIHELVYHPELLPKRDIDV